MHWITELNIPMDPSIIEMHNLHNGRLPCSTNTIKFWEYLLRVKSPHHTSSQNFTLVPSPTSYYRSLEKFNQFLVMNFYKLTPYTPDTNFVHQPPHSFPYFASTTLLQKASLSMPYFHNHLPNKT